MAIATSSVDRAIEALLASADPCIRYRTLTGVLGISPDSDEARKVRAKIPSSPIVSALLSHRDRRGRTEGHVYAKYTGAHWTLAALAEVAYPPGDRSLLSLCDQVYDCWLAPDHVKERGIDRASARFKSLPGVPILRGLARRCASQEGNALYATLALGLDSDRTDELADNLIRWQWPDGEWNCDRKQSARVSSFHESLLPLRALALHARTRRSTRSLQAADRAAEFLLERRLFRRKTNGSVIKSEFLNFAICITGTTASPTRSS